MTAVDEPVAPVIPVTARQGQRQRQRSEAAPGARRDCPDCGTYLVLMPAKERTPRWRCFGRHSHVFELGSGRQLVRVPSPRSPLDDGHRARLAEEIERWAKERGDDLRCLDEL